VQKDLFKRIARAIMPPLLWSAAKRLRSTPPDAEWHYLKEGWSEVGETVGGWNVPSVAAAQRRQWEAFVGSVSSPEMIGSSAGADRPDDVYSHNTMMSYCYVATLAARFRRSLSMLDWGGSVGHYAVLTRSIIPQLELDYHCREVPLLAELGATLYRDGTFHTTDDCLARRYDLVLASGSIQYEREWAGLVGRLAAASGEYLFLTRVPVALNRPSYTALQRAYIHGYGTEYVGWVLNRDEILRTVSESGLQLEREFLIDPRRTVETAPEPAHQRAFLFRREASERQ
jgi:putative methyltransferase (TIGR04325 family)